MSRQSPPAPGEIEAVRAELQRLGYLSHRVERYLLQDALRPERPLAAAAVLAVKVGVPGGALLALGAALLLLAWNPLLTAAPFDLALLVLHLLLPAIALFGGAFLVLAAVVASLLHLRPGLRIDALSLAVGLPGGLALAALALWRGRELLVSLSWPAIALLVAGGTAAATVLGRLLYGGLLALAIRVTDRAPRRRLGVGRFLLPAGGGVAIALLLLPAAVAARRAPPLGPGVLPASKGDRTLLIGIDGVLPAELDYLLARGALPTLGRIAARGARLTYPRDGSPPAAFWTTVATGVPSAAHGVAAVDSFRPLAMETALAASGPLRWYWAEVATPLGLAHQRPLLAARRRAFAYWELLGRGGAPVAVVNWWATYPAAPLPGLVVAHGAYQLLAAGGAGAVAPRGREAEVRAAWRAARAADGEAGLAIAAALGAAAAPLAELALRPDVFHRRLLAVESTHRPRAAVVYLPALDLATDRWSGGEVAFGDLVEAELGAADRLLAALLADEVYGTVLVVVDPGRRGASEGRALLWRAAGCSGAGRAEPTVLAAGLFRAAGLPQSAELPAPPPACRWSPPPARLPSYGARPGDDAGEPGRDEEYLHNLRSLGYL